MKEKWTADFSKPEKSCFDIKPEISHNAYLDNGSLFLGLRKKNCMAWLETANRIYVDQLIEAHFRFDGQGSYCAAGLMFRIVEGGTYYLALVSSKGYFRVDAVIKNNPSPLVGWTEVPGLHGNGVSLDIIAKGDHLIFLLNGRWVAEAWDSSIPGGHLGLALVSYDEDEDEAAAEDMYPPPGLLSSASQEHYVCKVLLNFLSVDSRPAVVNAEYGKWCSSVEISAESRLRLAESYAALDRCDAAYDQVLKAWRQREEAARSVMATYTEMRVRGELLFAARMASRLGQYEAAEEYVDTCFAMGDDASFEDEFDALSQKAIILSAQGKHADLVEFLVKRVNIKGDASSVAALYALLGHAYWNLQDYKAAAQAWDKAFRLNTDNGLYAACAADAYEKLGKNAQTLSLRIAAGNCFLYQQDNGELKALVPKLLAVGSKSWEARALAGKWAFAAGDYDRAEAELMLSDDLRLAARSKQEADPIVCCLRGDLLNRRGLPAEAIVFFSEAVRLSPDCEPYRLRLEETRSQVSAAKTPSALPLGDTSPALKKKTAKTTEKPLAASVGKAVAKTLSAKAEAVKAKKAPVKETGKTVDKKLAAKTKPKQAATAVKKTAAKPGTKAPGPAKKTPTKKTGSPQD